MKRKGKNMENVFDKLSHLPHLFGNIMNGNMKDI